MKTSMLMFLGLVLLAGATAKAQKMDAFPVQIKTDNGLIEGLYDVRSGLQMYFGVPYAKPPVGELRWRAPQPLDNWTGVKQTKAFGPRAVQARVFNDMVFRSDGINEDCLYLNVWTPARRNTSGLPVLVYFYGGGFVAGDGSEPRYDGAAMAAKGIVVVTVNYRLNIFGFFAHPELSKESPYKGSGNYGLLDQHMALKWVQKNIGAFGGDPKKVTIAGESAGSISVSAQMASPLSKGLIAGAIGESGAAIRPTLFPVPLAEAEKQGLEFATKAGVPTLSQLRALSTRDLYEIFAESKRFGFSTVIDGYFYPKSLVEIFKAKEQAQVPLLLGWNSSETPGMAFMQGQAYTEDNFLKRVRQEYPNDAEEVLKLYPHSSGEIEISATALASDRFIAYSTWKWFDLHRKNSQQPVYRYLFSKKLPPAIHQEFARPWLIGAPHACEIEYCMGNLNYNKEYTWTPEDFAVSEVMLGFFANFIKTGNPNGDKLPDWPAAQPNDATPPVMVIDTESHTTRAANDERYLFHDKFYKNF